MAELTELLLKGQCTRGVHQWDLQPPDQNHGILAYDHVQTYLQTTLRVSHGCESVLSINSLHQLNDYKVRVQCCYSFFNFLIL